MADAKDDKKENKDEQAEGSEGEGKSKKPMLIIIIAGVVLLLLILTIGVVFFLSNQKTPEAPVIEEKVGVIIPMRSFLVNLLDFGGRRYLKVVLALEADSSDTATEIEDKTTILRNYIINILSSKTFDDIKSVEGKSLLRKAIILKSNFILKKGKIHNVYFEEFIIQ
jgi:flagellar protein FliL